MKRRWIVALLFALSGAVTYDQLRLGQDRPVTVWLGGLPFGILSAFVLARSIQATFGLVILFGLVWAASFESAVFLISDRAWNPYIGMMLAGSLGGFGVAVAAGISNRSRLSSRSLVLVTATGGISALPFSYWEQRNSDLLSSHLLAIGCFALWQAAVGTTLFKLLSESATAD